MRQIQGAIIVASMFQLVIGYFGIIGLILRFITPLTITPAVSMVGLALFEVAGSYASGHWGIAIGMYKSTMKNGKNIMCTLLQESVLSLLGTILFMILFSQYLTNVAFKLPFYKFKEKKMTWTSEIYFFKLFPVLLTILVMWGICGIGTASGWFSEDSKARTDLNLDVIAKANWFRVPYPCEYHFQRKIPVNAILQQKKLQFNGDGQP